MTRDDLTEWFLVSPDVPEEYASFGLEKIERLTGAVQAVIAELTLNKEREERAYAVFAKVLGGTTDE